jgi:hypothetical protein
MSLRGKPALASLALAAALTLAACGGGTKTVTVEQSPSNGSTATTSSTGTSPQAGTSTAGGTSAPGTPSEPPTRIVKLEIFQSPSGNIGCMLIAGIARCDIDRRKWSPPARPASCPNVVDFGQGLELGGSGPARFVCAGDTARDVTSAKLAYGSGSQVGSFICVSRPSGVTCTNRHNGHGFFISIQSYRIF